MRGSDDVVTIATSSSDPTHLDLLWWCVGCEQIHCCNVAGLQAERPRWKWNRSTTVPTLEPSVLKDPAKGATRRCHSFVRDGVVQFLGDSDHALAGQNVPMLPEHADIWAHPWPGEQ